MLVLARNLGETIVIGGRIRVKILRIQTNIKGGHTVKLGIEAPSEVSVHREEVYEIIQRNMQAQGHQPATVDEPPRPLGQ